MEFKDRLRNLREMRQMTQPELAEAVGSTKQAISQYELGKRRPDYELLSTIADYFNVSTDYLLGLSNVTIRFLTEDDLKILDGLSENSIQLLNNFNNLNQEGQEKVLEFAQLLNNSEAYNICDKPELVKKEA